MERSFEMVTYDFQQRVAIVTGAGRGIGRALVHAFTRSNARVVAVDRDGDGLLETCAAMPAALALTADVSTTDGVADVFDAAQKHWGAVHICVNNAAVAPHAALLDERAEVWDRVYAANCRSTFLMTQGAARAMIATGSGGRIINFSSAASQRGGPGASSYASSRAAVEAFSRVAAVELAPHGILVNTVSPGLIDTQPKPLPPGMERRLAARIPTLPLARAGEPEEVAHVVLFLASDESSYLNGSIIHVDGGSSIGVRFDGNVVDDDPRYSWVTGRGQD